MDANTMMTELGLDQPASDETPETVPTVDTNAAPDPANPSMVESELTPDALTTETPEAKPAAPPADPDGPVEIDPALEDILNNNEAMAGMALNGTGPVPAARQAQPEAAPAPPPPAPTPQPVPTPQPPQESAPQYFNAAEFDDIISNPERLNDAFHSVAQRAQQNAQQMLYVEQQRFAEAIIPAINQIVESRMITTQFFEKNPDVARFPNQFAVAVAQVQAAEPNLSLSERYAKAASALRTNIRKAHQTMNRQPAGATPPAFAGGTTGRGAPAARAPKDPNAPLEISDLISSQR